MTVVRRSALLHVDALVPPALRSKMLADGARRLRDEAIASGRASPAYTTFVDGREGAREEEVKPDGAILYRFNLLGEAVTFALDFARRQSPVRSGAFRDAWIVAVDGRRWTGLVRDIPVAAQVTIVNTQPYARKIDTGSIQTIGYALVEATRQAVMRKFPNVKADRQFVTLPGGYVIKGHSHRRRRSSPGERMTYPAIVLSGKR